ncbi:YxeA family protein [Pediococcus pentosaceus]|uniref:YxeA family protein n=1 Tax=Pediococcus pentosaceus TaxID=1255 RepID=UPI000853EF41|nr:YxeA family protein [Pediococcus pentosaceus]MCE5961215.1 YxeA family protein [Pediococcus pentosaceus]
MKKIIWFIVAIVIIVAALAGWKAYSESYQGRTAYTVVPEKVPAKVATVDDSGKKVTDSYSYKYKFNFVLKNGQKKSMKYELIGTDPKPFTPGQLIKAEISKKRIIEGPNSVNRKDIPQKVRTELGIN